MHDHTLSWRRIALVAVVLCPCAHAQAPADVLRYYSPNGATDVRILDAQNNIVRRWPTPFTAHGTKLHDDGTLFRVIKLGKSPARGVQHLAFDGTVLWDYRSPPGYRLHHDVFPLSNGNVLVVGGETKTAAEAVAFGRNPALLHTGEFEVDTILEIQPTGLTTGVIVWEWHVWDHLIQDFDPTKPNFAVVGDHPELLDINFPTTSPLSILIGGKMFNHVNGIDYDPIHDWIVMSSVGQDEIWIIDHSTTAAEAAGHSGGRWGKGGDLLYRWGNPASYRAGTKGSQRLNFQHNPRFIPPGYPGAGNVTVFNNRFSGSQSAVFELELPLDASGRFIEPAPGNAYGPVDPVWAYTAPGFRSTTMSGAERLPNGNTLICSARQRWLFEVTPAGQIVWQHRSSSGGPIFHAHHTSRTLWASDETMPAATGGQIDFDLLVGTQAANELYLVLGSASGTSPGTGFSGGVTLPLNVDPFLLLSATYPNTPPVFTRTLGTLGSAGNATAAFALPPSALPVGFALDFAFLRFDQKTARVSGASNPVPLRIL